jgi:hypothetical protein
MEFIALTFCGFFAMLTLWIIGGETLEPATEEDAG